MKILKFRASGKDRDSLMEDAVSLASSFCGEAVFPEEIGMEISPYVTTYNGAVISWMAACHVTLPD